MKRTGLVSVITILFLFSLEAVASGQSTATLEPENGLGAQRVELASLQVASVKQGSGEQEEAEPTEPAGETVPDPLEPMNRAFFEFNDRLYFWVMKPG
ncbi:MAG: VacJ family lipoprotein, partial [Desulfobacterota bacterium]|nr:VacJ family lipoprotein [Thermodesulfobacteriota bacterium]